MVRIMIVDDHALMRRVVREVIEKEDDLEVVAEASNGLEAQEQAAHVKPEVVLMDLDMPECDGFEGTERVLASSPQSNVVIFTASHQERHLFQALQRGAMGYITKDIQPDALVHAIRCAARNELCLPGSFASQVVAHLRTLGKEHESHLWNELVGTDAQSKEEQKEEYQTSTVAYRIPRRPSMRRVHTLSKAVQQTNLEYPASPPSARPLTDREQEILDLMRKGQKNREIAATLCIAESTVHKHVQNIFEKLHARNRTEAIYLTSAN
jgi:two-component system response regulator DegU